MWNSDLSLVLKFRLPRKTQDSSIFDATYTCDSCTVELRTALSYTTTWNDFELVWATDDQLIIADFGLNALSSDISDFIDDELAEIVKFIINYDQDSWFKKVQPHHDADDQQAH